MTIPVMKMTKDDHTIEVVQSAFEDVWQHVGWSKADDTADLTPLEADADGTQAKPERDLAPGEDPMPVTTTAAAPDVAKDPAAAAATPPAGPAANRNPAPPTGGTPGA